MKMLIVEDNKDSRNLLMKQLHAHDQEVIATTNGVEALEQALKQPPDIIISDILMPVMDGFQLCMECKRNDELKAIPFVFYTATYTDEKDEELALKLGASKFIRKPIEPEQFMNLILDAIKVDTGKVVLSKPVAEEGILKLYNERLIKKLEEKMLELEKEITERKREEAELNLRANLLDSAMDSIIVDDFEGNILYANEAAYKSRGYTKEEFLQIKMQQLPAPQDREGIADRRARIQALGSLSFEIAHIRKDGTLMPIDVHVKTVDFDGKKVMLTIDRDITERRLSEEMLKTSELQYRRIVETAMEGIIQTDKDGRITFVNHRIEVMLGCTAEEIIGQQLTNFIFEEDLADYLERRNELRKGIPNRFERRLKRKDGSAIWTSVSTNIVKDEMGQFAGTFALMTDITERKQSQTNLEKSYQKLQKAVDSTIQTIALIVETRDPYTSGHQNRVAKLACAIGKEIGFSEAKMQGINAAGILHDIGKINVPSEILSKPGRLTEIEMSLIKTHSEIGRDILKTLELPWAICPAVLQHHERMDGSGYPSGIKGEAICLEARILAVADVVEAMASHRPYRPALGIDKALEEITKGKGKFYDSDVVDACLRLFKEKGFKFEL